MVNFLVAKNYGLFSVAVNPVSQIAINGHICKYLAGNLERLTQRNCNKRLQRNKNHSAISQEMLKKSHTCCRIYALIDNLREAFNKKTKKKH